MACFAQTSCKPRIWIPRLFDENQCYFWRAHIPLCTRDRWLVSRGGVGKRSKARTKVLTHALAGHNGRASEREYGCLTHETGLARLGGKGREGGHLAQKMTRKLHPCFSQNNGWDPIKIELLLKVWKSCRCFVFEEFVVCCREWQTSGWYAINLAFMPF